MRTRRHAWSAALVALMTIAAAGTASALDGTYTTTADTRFRCLSSELPLTAGDALSGTTDLAIDRFGKVTGSITLNGTTVDVKGKQIGRTTFQKIIVRGGGKRGFKLTCKRGVGDAEMTGTLKDRGVFAKGKHAATIDVSGASDVDLVFSADVQVVNRAGTVFSGPGTAAGCATALDVNAELKVKSKARFVFLDAKLRAMFRGDGVLTETGVQFSATKFNAFGLKAKGVDGFLQRTPPPP